MAGNVEFTFPIKGFNEAYPASETPQMTSGDMLNVRPFDTLSNRGRGGQRPGLQKWGNKVQISGASQPVVALCVIDSIK